MSGRVMCERYDVADTAEAIALVKDLSKRLACPVLWVVRHEPMGSSVPQRVSVVTYKRLSLVSTLVQRGRDFGSVSKAFEVSGGVILLDEMELYSYDPDIRAGIEVALAANPGIVPKVMLRVGYRSAELKPGVANEIRCVDTGEVFASLGDAGRAKGVSPQAISRAIRSGSRSAGFKWERVNEPAPSEAAAATARTEEGKPRRSAKSRAVMCIDTGEVFPSAKAAAVSAGVSAMAIYKSIRNGTKSGRKNWAYAPDDQKQSHNRR